MMSRLWKFFTKPKITDLALIIFSAMILTLLCNFKTIETKFLSCLEASSIKDFAILFFEVSLTISAISFVAIFLSFNKILLKTLLILIFSFSTIYFYVLSKFGIIVDVVIIGNALSSLGHSDEVIDSSIIIYFLLLTFLPAIFIARAEISAANFRKKIITALACVMIFIFSHFAFKSEKIIKLTAIKYSPINYLGSSYDYIFHLRQHAKQSQNRIPLNSFYKISYQNSSDLNIVLVIGESLRADHLGLNGYVRNTTPRLSNVANLLNFTIDASFNATTRSVTSMLSHRTKQDFVDIPPEKSMVSVFKNLGFKTYWYSAQSSKEFTNGMLNIMAAEADESFFRERLKVNLGSDKTYDADLLPHLSRAIQGGGNNFIILHSFGSHIRYHERYPENFRIFMPECVLAPSSCKVENLINSYDNTVAYTDYFLSEVINSVQGTNTILFYASDHGNFLGEDGVLANGNSDQESAAIKRVPMFFYATDQVLKNPIYKNKFATAATKTKSQNLSHDNLFDSVLDCSGVQSDLLERNLSICKKGRQ